MPSSFHSFPWSYNKNDNLDITIYYMQGASPWKLHFNTDQGILKIIETGGFFVKLNNDERYFFGPNSHIEMKPMKKENMPDKGVLETSKAMEVPKLAEPNYDQAEKDLYSSFDMNKKTNEKSGGEV